MTKTICYALGFAGIATASYFAVIVGLNALFYGELAFSPIVPTCCAGI